MDNNHFGNGGSAMGPKQNPAVYKRSASGATFSPAPTFGVDPGPRNVSGLHAALKQFLTPKPKTVSPSALQLMQHFQAVSATPAAGTGPLAVGGGVPTGGLYPPAVPPPVVAVPVSQPSALVHAGILGAVGTGVGFAVGGPIGMAYGAPAGAALGVLVAKVRQAW